MFDLIPAKHNQKLKGLPSYCQAKPMLLHKSVVLNGRTEQKTSPADAPIAAPAAIAKPRTRSNMYALAGGKLRFVTGNALDLFL
jgi:hypothetical protein